MYSHQNGETPLICAAFNGHSEVVILLLDAGALIEAKDNVSKRISILTYVCVLYTSIIQHDKCKVSYYSITIFYYNM